MIKLALALYLSSTPLFPPQEASEKGAVRLIVVVVVDQMIPEHLDRLQPWLHGGLQRFAEGEVWPNAAHGHSKSETGPGHASIGTGMYPNHNGIVGNAWVDYATGRSTYCADDPEARLVTSTGLGEPGSAAGHKNLLVDGFAQHLRRAAPTSKSYSIAGKDRAAVMTVGAGADLALWWERRSGTGFGSSSAYVESLPKWVCDWNASWSERASGWSWEANLEGLEASGVAADLRPGEPTTGFPHRAPEVEADDDRARAALATWVYVSPLVDQFVLELAAEAVTREALGVDDAIDYLFVGLSACDTVGHRYGPYSQEVTDLMLRLDESLGSFFGVLDERVGKQHWIAALSSDHGVLPLPEALAGNLIPAQRVFPKQLQAASDLLSDEVNDLFGAPYFLGLARLEGRLDVKALEAHGVDADEVAKLAITSFLQNLPWMHVGYTRKQLIEAQSSPMHDDALLTLSARSFHPARSLDFQLVPKPWILLSDASIGTSHGSPWPYDRRVPLAFIGQGSKSGSRRFEACQTVDILPTLFERAGIPIPPNLDGKVLR